jgi:hypothetical protein
MRPALPTTLTLACVLLATVLCATVPLWAEEPEPPAPAPVRGSDDAAIQRLVEGLGSSDFAVRERASRDLLALGERARPVLEQTMKNSENMEARWRAEQILRRLDQEGERPMGQESEPLQPPAGPGVLPPGAPPMPPLGSGMDEIERRMEEIRRRFLDGFGSRGFGPGGFGDFGPSSERLEAPGLRLDAQVFAGLLVQVTILDVEAQRTYRGRTLEDVLESHPELGQLDGMAALKQKWAGFKQANPELFRLGRGFGRPQPGSGFSFTQSGQGVEVVHDADGVTVRVRELDENGKETVREVKGATLDEIKEQHPDIARKLDGFGVTVQLGPVQIFRNRPGGRRLPLPPAPPRTEVTPADDDAMPVVFGVRIVAPEPVLAVHLGLEPGHGALVTQVVPDTQAAAMGLERYDVIVAVNGEPVTDHRLAADVLRGAGAKQGPLRLDLIRRGVRTSLER